MNRCEANFGTYDTYIVNEKKYSGQKKSFMLL